VRTHGFSSASTTLAEAHTTRPAPRVLLGPGPVGGALKENPRPYAKPLCPTNGENRRRCLVLLLQWLWKTEEKPAALVFFLGNVVFWGFETTRERGA
jgi:uncharacterized Rmd1/YagE family protein